MSLYSHSSSFYDDDDEFILHDDQLCAGLPHNSRQELNSKNNYVTPPGKDACQGDSGGPLICSIDEKAVLVGVVSHGSGCGKAGYPGIYAKIDYFKEWLKSGFYLISFIYFIISYLLNDEFSSCRTNFCISVEFKARLPSNANKFFR